MQHKAYLETIDWLFQQFPSYQTIGAAAYKPDLVNIQKLCDLVGNPQHDLKFVHIAGTNGKGSTSSMLASILTEAHFKVGLFTSPHIIDFRERIRVNGVTISEAAVIDFCRTIQEANLDFEPSFFEITFAMALVHFKQEKCTICVIETGLGGRLDATNVITPLISVITNIAIEHTQFLGTTLHEIAGEKAGIIKPTIPVVIGETTPETKTVFNAVAEKNKSRILWCEDSPLPSAEQVPLLGEYQRFNLRTVLCTLKLLRENGYLISEEAISTGLSKLHTNSGIFGRMQIINKTPLVILDVSHNVDGVKKTLDSIEKINKGQLHIIYGTSSDKNYREIIALFPNDARLSLCSFSNQRSLSLSELQNLAQELHPTPQIHTSVKEAIKHVQSSANKEDTILVFGSFFLISDFF